MFSGGYNDYPFVLFLTLFCIVIAILAIHLFPLLKGNKDI